MLRSLWLLSFGFLLFMSVLLFTLVRIPKRRKREKGRSPGFRSITACQCNGCFSKLVTRKIVS
jgi:hypothetical protein